MKKWLMLLLAVLTLTAGVALADVSNEVVVGLEADSIDEAKGNAGVDITDKIENDNSMFILQYTRFFAPLKDDGKPIELRRFYQHPSTLSAGLVFIGAEGKDSTTLPANTSETNASVLLLGGEFYLPTNTGLFLNIGMGSGTEKESFGGTAQPDTDLTVGQFELGVRQYIGESFALHLRLNSESLEMKQSVAGTTTDDKAIAYLGARGVIADVVGLALELGGGERELSSGGATTKFDVSAVNLEIAGYFGKHFSVRLAIEAEEEERLGDAPGNEHINTVGTSILGFRYWFSETFGLDLPLYSEKTEHKVGGVTTDSTTQSGVGLYASFRF